MASQVSVLVKELLEATKTNEIQWKKKNPKILSDIPGGNAIISVFSTKYKTNNIYICTRKYIENRRDDPRYGEYTVDIYKESMLVFDGIELLYMFDFLKDQDYSYSLSELTSLFHNNIDIF